jgi:hypothetical protein
VIKACTLTTDGRALQRGRFVRIRGDIVEVDRSPTTLRLEFGPSVDEDLLRELVATERECCAFLEIEHEGRVLRIGSDDPRDLDHLEAMVR